MRRLVVALTLVTLAFTGALAVSEVSEKVISVFIYNFAINGQWPDSESEFTIGVLEQPALARELSAVSAEKTVGSQKIKVVQFSNSSKVQNCNILFIPAAKSNSLSDISGKLSGSPTLIVTEKHGLAKSGSGINFVIVDGKLRFEVNNSAIEKRGIKLSNKIKSLGIAVD
jgi:hypothetical protein